MTEATQTANPTDARQASMSRVVTQETILAKLTPAESTSATPESEKTQPDPSKEGEAKPKKTASERIQELAAKRNEAEAKAEAAERKAAELEARIQAMQAQAKPLEEDARPVRSAYATDDDYIDAVADWKAKRAIAEREKAQAQARAEAEQAEIASQWSKRQEQVMKDLPDYADVIGKSEISVPNHIHQAILESEQGPQIAYYLALHPDEAKKLALMKPVAGIKRIAALERDLAEIEEEEKTPEKAPPVQKSKAPAPIETIKSVPSSTGSSSNSYEEYKRRREAEKRK
jgi:hypothetical protein